MSKNLFQIDVSNLKNFGEEDLIKINISNDEFVQVNFSKLISYSKYIRDKYKYSEALITIENDLKNFATDKKIKKESIRHFIELIEKEKVTILNEHYHDIYRLSEYFDIPIFLYALDKIREETLYKDVNFTLQFLSEALKTTVEEEETKLNSKIEEFLTTRINECILNDKFGTLPISTIYRLLEKSSKETLDHNLLVEFILKSIDTRFIFLKFIQLHKLNETEVDRFFKIMKEQNKMNKERYFEYIQFDLQFFNRLFDETNQTKNELEQTKEELNKMKTDFQQTKIKLDQTEDEFNQTKEELEQAKMKLKEAVDDIKQTKSEMNKYTQSVIVAGFDKFNQLGVKSNNINKTGTPIISPPLILSYDSLLSYSIYNSHSVLVKKDGSLHGIGYNTDGTICGSLTKTEISQFTEFSINNNDNHQLTPISAVCSYNGTLYMLSKSTGIGKQLVYCDSEINGGNPIFLDIGNHEPIALFGGRLHTAAISKEGEIIFIQRELVKNSPNSLISAVSIPYNEKAKSIACCDDSIIVLSSNGRVFSSPVKSESNILGFSIVKELAGEEIVCISGIYNHFLAVSKEGRVFGCGSNENGKLGLGKETKSVSSFTEILSLGGYQIRSAYAGYSHSLFETCEGQILSCGSNISGQLLINKGPSDDVYSPTETTIRGGATFCIAGSGLSVVFISIDPPPNTPNKCL